MPWRSSRVSCGRARRRCCATDRIEPLIELLERKPHLAAIVKSVSTDLYAENMWVGAEALRRYRTLPGVPLSDDGFDDGEDRDSDEEQAIADAGRAKDEIMERLKDEATTGWRAGPEGVWDQEHLAGRRERPCTDSVR